MSTLSIFLPRKLHPIKEDLLGSKGTRIYPLLSVCSECVSRLVPESPGHAIGESESLARGAFER